MDELAAAFSSLGLRSDALAWDVRVIIDCYLCELHALDTKRLRIEPGVYANSQELYGAILEVLASLRKNQYLIELMPYIDDYLQYYDAMCGL